MGLSQEHGWGLVEATTWQHGYTGGGCPLHQNVAKPNFTAAALQAAVEQGWVTRRKHPDFPYYVYNYTPRTTFERQWNEVTEQCRGLILDADHNIIARPFRKFFGLAEYVDSLGRVIPDEPFEAWDKLDGSLGISFLGPDGKLGISTRGSFESEQAIKGTEMIRTQLCCTYTDPTLTYLFEIIYPDNRYVVNYGDYEGLVLLAVIVPETGEELPIEPFGDKFKLAKRLPAFKRMGSVKRYLDQQRNIEGAVIRFQRSGLRLKVKADEYKRLFRIVSSTNAKTIWQALHDGVDPYVLVNENVPSHYKDYVLTTVEDLRGQYNTIAGEVMELFQNRPPTESRKELARYFTSTPYAAPLFALLDGRFDNADRLIWRIVEPTIPRLENR